MSRNMITFESDLSIVGTTTARFDGEGFLIGSAITGTVVILKGDTSVGATIACWREGQFKDVAKQTDAAWVKGNKIFFAGNSTRKFTKTSTSNTRCGKALEAATTAATTGKIQLVAI